MTWVSQWWEREVVAGHKGPLLVAFLAFVVTFVATRAITRAIRAGRGPFHNLSEGSVHLHHSTPGIILLVSGAFVSLGAVNGAPLRYLAALFIGMGASLVLDEFAMIFHLQDVYWAEQGQLSVNIVTLAAACIGLGVVGFSPFDVPGLSETESTVRGLVVAIMLTHFAAVVVTAAKGKYPTALIGLFVAPIAGYAAVRLARPGSLWARRFYDSARLEHATRRAAYLDARWGPVRRRWDDVIGGSPTTG